MRCRSACSATRPIVVPELARAARHFDLVTDQTAAHDPLTGYVPAGLAVRGRGGAPRVATRTGTSGSRASRSCAHVEALLEFVRAGCYVFDYGNNLRGEAHDAGVDGCLLIPGLRPGLYPAALLSRHRAVPVGRAVGRPGGHRGDRRDAARVCSRTTALLQRWLELAPERVAFQGLPARICWLGYGDRAKAGLAINELVRIGRGARRRS